MQITHKLIQNFLDGQCSKEEEEFVQEWLKKHPEHLNALMTEESWDNFIPGTTDTEASLRMLDYIDSKIQPRRKSFNWLAAASVVLILSIGAYFGLYQQKSQPVAILRQPASYILSRNELPGVQKLVLPDGSIAMLAPGSTITYDSAFRSGREIVLSGEVSFSVAKDSTKPFCVHAKNINVTALGTIFSVADYDTVLTSVKLFEGRVVIRKEAHASKSLKEIFLNPGQELSFNNKDFSYAVKQIKTDLPGHKDRQIAKTATKPLSILRFENKLLSDVFLEIQKQYNIKIEFNAGALQDLRFTGTHNPASETLEDFLNTIAMLNDLKVKKTRSSFLITLN